MTLARCLYDGPVGFAQMAFDGSIALSIYDFMYHDTDDVKPFSSQADQGTELANQSLAAPRFAGLAGDARLVGDTAAVALLKVLTDVIMEVDCTSATFEVGDLVAPVEQSGGTALENQKVVKTTDPAIAIGKVMRRYSSATTRVLVWFRSRVAFGRMQVGGYEELVTTTAAAAGTVLANATAIQSGFVLVTDADDTKGVRLPDAAPGKVVVVKNNVANKILKVYPAVGDTINAGAANAVYNQTNGAFRTYVAYNSTAWYTDPETIA